MWFDAQLDQKILDCIYAWCTSHKKDTLPLPTFAVLALTIRLGNVVFSHFLSPIFDISSNTSQNICQISMYHSTRKISSFIDLLWKIFCRPCKIRLRKMEIFNFLWLIWNNYLPLAPLNNDRSPWPQFKTSTQKYVGTGKGAGTQKRP